MNIEVFTVWAPNRTPGYENIEVRSEQEIMGDLEQFEGYWFMGLQDVIDYKDKMGRDKEVALSQLIKQYEEAGATPQERGSFLSNVAKLLTAEFYPEINA
jgi:hypothetical protein